MTTTDASTTGAHVAKSINFKNSKQEIQREFKVRLLGLRSNTKYRFMVRCKLNYNNRMMYSDWSSRIEFQTKRNVLTVITNQTQLDIASLKHQLKAYQLKCDELEAENQSLMMKMNSYLPPHHSWDYEEIVQWIMRIQDGIFKPYKETLRTNLKKEEIDGPSLYMLDMSDLQRIGITKFAHKKILISHIHKLTEHDGVPEFQYDHKSAQTVVKTPLSQQKRIARVPRGEDEVEDISDFAETATPRMAFPKQTTRFAMPASVPNGNSNTNITDAAVEPSSKKEEKETTESDITDDGTVSDKKEEKKIEKLPSLQADKESESNSYGLTQSVQNLLLSSPENEPPKQWKYKNGVLMVRIIKGTDVDNMDEDDGPGSASDPYVELELKGHYRKERTKVIYNDANPVWNERFQLFPENPKKDVLKLKLWDKDAWTFDDEIGTVFIPVIDVLNANGHIEQPFDVVGSKCEAKLHLELKYKELQH